MNDQQVRRWTGAFGVASGVLILVGQPLYLVGGTAPRLQNGAQFSDFVTKNHNIILTLVFGAGVVWGMLVLVGDVLESASALDTVGGQDDPAAVRALWEGSVAAFGGVGLIMAALFIASARYAILATGALPRWIGWVAFLTAILNLAAVPSIYGGTDATGFYTADGLASVIGLLPLLIWILITSISMITMREASAPKAVNPRRGEDL